MDFDFEQRWRAVVSRIESQFGEDVDIEAILFLIGVQELGAGQKKYKKDDKLNLMHIGICTVLAPFGHYAFSHYDNDGWPHFELLKPLPFLTDREQKTLMRRAVVEYFEANGLMATQS